MTVSGKRTFRQTAPDRMELVEGGGCAALFGAPFLAAGIFLVLASFRIVPIDNASEVDDWAWPVLTGMGLLFAAAGAWLVFGRTWTILDSSRRLLIKQWGLLVPMRTREYRSSDCHSVAIGYSAGDSDSVTTYPVRLKLRKGPDLVLSSPAEYSQSRELAAVVARYLGLRIEDASTGTPAQASPEQFDQPLQLRLRTDDRQVPLVARPPSMRSRIDEAPGELRIEIPLSRMSPVVLVTGLMTLFLITFACGPISKFFRQTRTPEPVAWVFLSFLLIGFVIAPAMAFLNAFLKGRYGGTIVTVSSSGISVEERGAWRVTSRTMIAASEILGIDYSTAQASIEAARRDADQHLLRAGESPAGQQGGAKAERLAAMFLRLVGSRGITIKTRTGLTSFGQNLGEEELAYLQCRVVKALLDR